jgi:hypothetical protein
MRKRRRRRWDPRYEPSWYSTAELDQFLAWLDQRISKKAPAFHHYIQQRARIQSERDRRTSET